MSLLKLSEFVTQPLASTPDLILKEILILFRIKALITTIIHIM